jgi:HSP20 family molecular chaperone IbpA
VDIVEDDKEYLIKADLPEMKKEDVKVVVEDGIVSVSGERKSEKEEKGKRFHRIERSYGSFRRGFLAPDNADAAKVNAEFKDGVLKVHLPKSPTTKPKADEVKLAPIRGIKPHEAVRNIRASMRKFLHPETKDLLRAELEFLSTPRNEEMKQSLRIKCARRALELLEELETKLNGKKGD